LFAFYGSVESFKCASCLDNQNNVIEVVHVHPMTVTIIEKSCLCEIQQIQRVFVLGCVEIICRCHKINYDVVTKPKQFERDVLRKLDMKNDLFSARCYKYGGCEVVKLEPI